MSHATETTKFPPSAGRRYARLDQRPPFTSDSAIASPARHTPSATSVSELLEFDLAFLGHWLWAGLKWIAVLAIIGALGGLVFGMLAKPRYTATTSLVIEPSNMQVLNDNLFPSYTQGDAQLAAAESRLQMLTSGNVLARVVEQLDLAHDPDFVPPQPSFSLSALLSSGDGPARPAELTALETLGKRVTAKRVDKSFIVDLSAASDDPNKSVTIANAVVNAFGTELAEADAAGAKRVADSLEGRLVQMREDVNSAETAVETFKQQNNLQSSSGELVNAQSMTQITAQRNQAEVSLSQAQSKLAELRGAATSGGITNQTLQSATITALRQQYSTLKQQFDSEATRLGPRHPTLASLKAQVDAVSQEIAAEARRLVDAAQAEVDETTALLASLDQQAAAIRTSLSNDNNAQIELRALERDAQAKASVYQAFLERIGEISERERIDATTVRIISAATPPVAPSYPPRTVLLMMVGAVAGAIGGSVLALVLGWMRNRRAERALRTA